MAIGQRHGLCCCPLVDSLAKGVSQRSKCDSVDGYVSSSNGQHRRIEWLTPLTEAEKAMSQNNLVTCIFTSWSPQIGDPTAIGWLTVVAYILAATLSVLVFRRQSGRQRVFWLGLAMVLLAMAINKQLDLQSALTAAGRCLAQAQGWYEDRQSVQIAFIISVAVICLFLSIALAWTLRRDLGRIWIAVVGVTILLAFVVMRAAGFHHFDSFIGYEIASVQMNWVMELGGILLIALNAVLILTRRGRPRK